MSCLRFFSIFPSHHFVACVLKTKRLDLMSYPKYPITYATIALEPSRLSYGSAFPVQPDEAAAP